MSNLIITLISSFITLGILYVIIPKYLIKKNNFNKQTIINYKINILWIILCIIIFLVSRSFIEMLNIPEITSKILDGITIGFLAMSQAIDVDKLYTKVHRITHTKK